MACVFLHLPWEVASLMGFDRICIDFHAVRSPPLLQVIADGSFQKSWRYDARFDLLKQLDDIHAGNQ